MSKETITIPRSIEGIQSIIDEFIDSPKIHSSNTKQAMDKLRSYLKNERLVRDYKALDSSIPSNKRLEIVADTHDTTVDHANYVIRVWQYF
jgi:hypothetical protein